MSENQFTDFHPFITIQGSSPRWWHKNPLTSLPHTATPKLQLTQSRFLSEKPGNQLSDSYISGKSENSHIATIKMGRKGWDMLTINPIPAIAWHNQDSPNNTTQGQAPKKPIKKCAEDLNKPLSKEDIQLASRYMKCPPESLEKCKSKPQRGITLHLIPYVPFHEIP